MRPYLFSPALRVLALLVLSALYTAVESTPHSNHANPLTVTLDYATYTGYTNKTTGLNNFRGIGYAQPPVGKLRWKKPAPPATKTAPVTLPTTFPDQCPQSGGGGQAPSSLLYGNEDCLYLSVIAPPDAHDLPVLMFIHGGGYNGGAGYADFSEMLVNSGKSFIYVVIQYRLGAFGYLSSESMVEQGGVPNAGLWDQKAALEWVNKYIRHFGGDPKRVTVSGESAGAGAVLAAMLAEGGSWGTKLFHNSIAASPYLPPQYDYDDAIPEAAYTLFVSKAGCGKEKGEAAVFACLQKADTKALQDASQYVNSQSFYGTWTWLPVTDGKYLQSIPSKQLYSGKINGARLLTSNNANEGAAFVPPNITNSNDLSAWTAGFFPKLTKDEMSDLLKAHDFKKVPNGTVTYATTGDSGLTALSQSSFASNYQQNAMNILAEAVLICPAYWMADSYNRKSIGGKSWHYQYSVPPAEHGVDIDSYYTANFFTPGNGTMSDNGRLAMQYIWANMVTKNNPTLSSSIIAKLDGHKGAEGMFDSASSSKWKAWTGGQHGSTMLNVNMTGGVEVKSELPTAANISIPFTQHVGPGLKGDFNVADAYTWEGGRGGRCNELLRIASNIPE